MPKNIDRANCANPTSPIAGTGRHDQRPSVSAPDLSLCLELFKLENGQCRYSETFESLSEGLQNALWELGGVPLEHRSDRMSAAVNNLVEGKEFTRAYEDLLRHYRLVACRGEFVSMA